MSRSRGRRWRWPIAALAAVVLAYVGLGLLRPEWFLQAEFARQRWLAGAAPVVLDAAQHRWSVLEAGQGPPLVLVHGFTGSKENWLPVVARLARDYRVLVPDLPGWGDSERKPAADYGFDAQAERLAEFLRTHVDTPARLVGHSMGGGIAVLVAARQPELVERLVLVDAAGVLFRENAFAARVLAGEHPFAVVDRASLDSSLGWVFATPPWLPWPVDRALIARRRADLAFEIAVLDRVGRSEEALTPGRHAAGVLAPTLLLWCREDRVIDADAARLYAQAIADTRTVWLDGCNHMPMMEQPAATAAALEAFLR